jgi:hypothetical protein
MLNESNSRLFQFVLVFAFVQYKPVTYGLYEFPFWGFVVAWIMVVLALLPTPVYMIYKLCKVGGSIKRVSVSG